jgi:precorrin-2/cobalt-factor-2 C20-methyltransferase
VTERARGKLIGVGVGPGDPELITLKAMRALQSADAVAHFAKAGNRSNGRSIAAAHVPAGTEQLALLYPVTTEIPACTPAYRRLIGQFYEDAAATIAARLDAGQTVAVICEGDPLFYGSYMHLHVRLAPRYQTEVIAGVTGVSGCWSAAQLPIAQGNDIFTVLPATLPEAELIRRLNESDAVVIMKLGRHLPKVRRALVETKRLAAAIYVERGTMSNAVVLPLAQKADHAAPYFAVVLVPGWETRP